MALKVKVPGVGESVQEGMVHAWRKKTGDFVKRDDILLELETDKATVEVASETSGVLTTLVAEGAVVKVGDVIAEIDETKSASTSSSPEEIAPTSQSSEKTLDNGPAVRKIAAENKIDLSQIEGTGRGGRVTKEDLLKPPSSQKTEEKAPVAAPATKPAETSLKPASLSQDRTETRKPMSMLRRRIAERLLESQKTAAILTTFNEIDMTQVMAVRERYKDSFQKKYDLKLGFMGFFVKAAVEALKEFPLVNAYIDGTDILYHSYCDIGVAVSTEKGLMVPIIRDADKMALVEVEQTIAHFAKKARDNKISVEDLQGGTFTVSNGGVFGSLLSTPILNPPQSGILGMHKTQLRPMVMPDGKIEARPMMYIALSYDHRIIDGKEAVGFLVKIKDCIEDPSRMLLGV